MTDSSGPPDLDRSAPGRTLPGPRGSCSTRASGTPRDLWSGPPLASETPALRRPVDVRARRYRGPPRRRRVDCASTHRAPHPLIEPTTKPASASASVSHRAILMRTPPSVRRESRNRFYLSGRGTRLSEPAGVVRQENALSARVADDARADGAHLRPPAAARRLRRRDARRGTPGSAASAGAGRARGPVPYQRVVRREPASAHHLESVGFRRLGRIGRRDQESRVVANRSLLRRDPVRPVGRDGRSPDADRSREGGPRTRCCPRGSGRGGRGPRRASAS